MKKSTLQPFSLKRPSNIVEMIVPATNATTYNNAFPTTWNTKIPPWGAINVQLKAIERAPAIPEPTTQEGMTRIGSAAA